MLKRSAISSEFSASRSSRSRRRRVRAPRQGALRRHASACGQSAYSYAGLQSNSKAHGVSATLAPVKAPSVLDGHVGGWVGVGGTTPARAARPSGSRSASPRSATARQSQHVLRGHGPRRAARSTSSSPRTSGRRDTHRVSVLEMARRKSWWRVWVDGQPVSPPIHLPGSHGAWYPQAVAENWNGGTGACNGYAYRSRDVALAQHERRQLAAARRQLRLPGPGLPRRPDRGDAGALPRDEPVGAPAPRQRIVSGVPTGISLASFRIDSFGMRMQPCETRPGGSAARSCRGCRRSRRRASR